LKTQKNGNNFYDTYNMKDNTQPQNLLAVYYFSWTTLSTVGFGDFYPYSNIERVVMSITFLVGVSVFSFIIGELLEAFDKTKSLFEENEDADNLSKFNGLLKKFNVGK